MEQVEVIGLEEQLTIRSRNQRELLDVWIAVRWNVVKEDWASAFRAIAEAERGALSSHGAFEIVSLTDRQGWIVARGINAKLLTPKDVEGLVRDLVDQVNANATPATAGAFPERDTWTSRLLGTVAALDVILLGFGLASRRRRNADVASS